MKDFLLWALTVTIGVLTILVLPLGTVYWQMMTTDHHAEEAAKGELYLTYFDYDDFYGAERQSPNFARTCQTAHDRPTNGGGSCDLEQG